MSSLTHSLTITFIFFIHFFVFFAENTITVCLSNTISLPKKTVVIKTRFNTMCCKTLNNKGPSLYEWLYRELRTKKKKLNRTSWKKSNVNLLFTAYKFTQTYMKTLCPKSWHLFCWEIYRKIRKVWKKNPVSKMNRIRNKINHLS